ncbi:Thyroid adenoma-associated [Amphibalanus amphitrite]|uniref:Thyroid adenoma-associated n=1 Tax=Amphibalanus amphitrite TaxID=1232801 RepID=A0A6A4W6Y0_AMPAM|nr:Thyroid adenoma-associated [Amphibalanus amphitrite]
MSSTIFESLSSIKEFLHDQNDSCNIDIQASVRKCMNCLKDSTVVSDLSEDQQTEIKTLLLSLLSKSSNPKETNLLAAISICLLLHQKPAEPAAAEFLTLLELPSPQPSYHQQTLLLGLFGCGKQDLLGVTAPDRRPMSLHLGRAVLLLCSTPYNIFQSFHLLDLLLHQLASLPSLPPSDALTSELLRPAAAALSSSWERQCDGLPELLTRCWAALLRLHARLQPGGEYVDDLLRPLAALPWSSKTKLHTLYVVAQHIGCQELLRRVPDLTSGLVEAASGHHLASISTDLYQEVLQVASDDQLPQLERQLADLLVSDDSQTCQTALLRWLPAAVRCRSASGRRLLTLLPADSVPGWTARLAAVRLLRESDADAGPDAEAALRAGLTHPEPGVRLAAAGACWGRRAVDSPPAHLCPPLLAALVSCLSADSASLRHALCAELRRLVPRLRTACLRGRPPPAHLLQLLRGLVDAVLEGLSPGSSFQRCCTCLVALQEIVSHLYALPAGAGAARKGVVPPQTAVLLRYLAEHRPGGITWDIVTRDSLRTLLLCLYDETDDVRETALKLLITYWIPAGLLTTFDREQLTDWAARLADRPNFHDVETAAALCLLSFEAGRSEAGGPPTELLEELLSAAEGQAEGAKRDLFRAAREAPVHGRLACLRRCLCGSDGAGLTPEMVEKCVNLLEDVVDTMLKALAGQQVDEHGGTAPSFAAMGEAVESVVAAAGGDTTRSSALSNQYQLVLSCCWLSLKECSLFLGELTSYCLSAGGPGMSVTTLRAVVATIRRVLTGCRHKGAIESARLAWSRLSTAALRHASGAVRDVPAAVLRGVLAELRAGGARSSATRRGAGLPMLVHTLLAADRQPGLADSTVSALLEVAASPLPPSPTTHASAPTEQRVEDCSAGSEAQTTDCEPSPSPSGAADADGAEADLPHTIALHILTGLMSDAVVSAQVTSRLCDVTCAALAGLASPVWSIR